MVQRRCIGGDATAARIVGRLLLRARSGTQASPWPVVQAGESACRCGTATEGFRAYDCDDDLAARLRREIEEANGAGYDRFNTSRSNSSMARTERRSRRPLGSATTT